MGIAGQKRCAEMFTAKNMADRFIDALTDVAQ
jgi:hypothetical protein